ncbi:nicotinamide/nicotinic acid mononucleotide adenylyltransferase 1 isoform X1 [Stomoxys calcitrans]|uniref:Nicotinamide-nucleotide adenylyltransferase n=2 Tax=Stomoxys calcitrans TaxID=35570 RepID=A0A1I8PVB5_STOCA|nr:nicotinamide/nicotinic acid mononucleotide adenylyltransferase 1 isoform X1 [Stomoxys calcitrans]XP_013115949.1 nicotinamide/nicotinic acid mononucleotide adenylyltransferase 1 isoform X1 [Stomoxys calcitrans]
MSAILEETSNRLLPRIVLIACGSFSPPTPMHLRMFEIAKDHFEMQGTHKVIGGIVSPTHDAYGKKGLAPGKHRCAMVKLALQSSSWIRLSEWETMQDGWSRTQTVLQYHQNFMNNYINSPDLDNMNGTDKHIPGWLPPVLRERRDPVQLRLLCGADLLESFAVPGLWAEDDIEDIISNHGLVVISRSGSDAEKFVFESDILTKYQRNITLVTNWVSNEVSSTMIRRLLSRGQSAKYLIDDLVLEYIKRFGLFQSKTKYITSLTRPPKQNFLNIAYNNHQTNMQTSSNETTPSDVDDDDDDGDVVTNKEEYMDETDFSTAKIIMPRNNLDNRKPNVFCCGDSKGSGVINKLLGGHTTKKKPSGPGQAVQVVTNEYGVTEIFDEDEMQSKKFKMADV